MTFRHKKRAFILPKIPKKFRVQGLRRIWSEKLQVEQCHCSLKTFNNNVFPMFRRCHKEEVTFRDLKCMIYRPELYHFQIRNNCQIENELVVRLKILMKANTVNPQMKYCPYPKYVVIYRPDLNNLQARKKLLKKQLRIETDLSKYSTTK